MLHISANIKKIRKLFEKTQQEFADLMNVTLAMQKSYEGNRAKPDNIYLEHLSDKSGFSVEELKNISLTAKEIVEKVEKVSHETPSENENQAVAYLQKRQQMKNNEDPFLVPFIDIPAQAGYAKAYQSRDYQATLKKYPILPNVDPHGAVWNYFQVEGDSMEPTYEEGDVILASQVLSEDWKDVKDFYTYVVVTDTQLLIKDVLKESEKEWILLSQNENYEPILLPIENVKQLWVRRRHVKASTKKQRMYDVEAIRNQLKKG